MAGAPPAFLHLLWWVKLLVWRSLECYSSERSVLGGSTWLNQWISKMPNLQPSGQSAELFTQASLKNTVCPKELWLFLWCEAILTSVKPLSIFPFPKSVSLCSSTCTYIHYATYSQMLVNSTEEKHFWSDAGMLTQLTLAWRAHSSLPVAIETDQ